MKPPTAALVLAATVMLVTAIHVHAQDEATLSPTSAPSAPWIAYQAIVDGAVNIGLVHADGSDDHAIPGGPGNRWHPDWSPDGTRIAYDWNLPSGVAQIAVTNLDGTVDHSLLACDGSCYGNGGPAWSPDGGSIGFDGAEGPTDGHAGDLCYLALLDLATGSVDRFLKHDGCHVADSYLRFSPDGSHVVFQRSGPQGMALVTATLDGEAELQLTEWGFGARPDWSPDGEWIVLMDVDTCDCPALQDIDLYRVRADGSELTQLTDPGDDGTFDAYPRWLPDGGGIIFSRCSPGGLMCDTRTIAADGSSDRLLVPGLGRGEVHAVMQAPG